MTSLFLSILTENAFGLKWLQPELLDWFCSTVTQFDLTEKNPIVEEFVNPLIHLLKFPVEKLIIWHVFRSTHNGNCEQCERTNYGKRVLFIFSSIAHPALEDSNPVK